MIYLIHAAVDPDRVMAEGLADDVVLLMGSLLAVDTPLTRSKLYHGLKRLQGGELPLVVAPISDVPKIKGAEAGTTRWLRERLA